MSYKNILIILNGDWAQSPIPNPQSPIPNPQSPIKINLFFKNNKKIIY
jgi:hypothetical protein